MKNIRRIVLMMFLFIVPVALTGCDDLIEDEERNIDQEKVLEASYNDDMQEVHQIVREKDLDDFTFITMYDTIDYDLNEWYIIDNKTIQISAWTQDAPADWDVIIEHVHIDLFITNRYENRPTLLQDSMDDKYHGYMQDGFKISDNVVYENIFGIIGATPELHASLRASRDYSLRLKDLREEDFANNNYDSNTLQVIFDVMVKKPGNDYYETIAVYDEIIIPVGYDFS